MNSVILSLVLALVAWGQQPCDKGGVTLGKEFELKVGQEATVAGEELKVSFDSVGEDSRCPEGVECIWAGSAKIAVRLQKGSGKPSSFELNTGVEPRQHSFMGYEIKLVSLRPYPKANVEIDKKQYVATLSVSKK